MEENKEVKEETQATEEGTQELKTASVEAAAPSNPVEQSKKKADKPKEKKNGMKTLAAAGVVLLVGNIALSGASLMASLNAMDNSKAAKNNSVDALKYGQNADEKMTTLLEKDAAASQTSENDVVIAGSYTIKSTTELSQAYLSGDTSSLSDRDKETIQMASDVLDEIITDGMSDYEKEKAVYLWMTKELGQDRNALLVIPTASDDVDNPYGVLKNGNAVCVGYATTFRLFMEMLNIECMVVHNTEEYHSWDLVKLDDEWYHVDIYSDAGVGNYAYFNLSDSMMSEEWDRDFFPSADGIKYNYFYDKMVEANDVYEIPDAIRKAIDNKEYGVFIKLTGDLSNSELAIATQMVETLGSYMTSKMYQSVNGNSYYDNTSSEDYVEGEKVGFTVGTLNAMTGAGVATGTDAAVGADTATGTDAGLNGSNASDVDIPVGINDYRWITDPEDGAYILFVSFASYYSDYTDNSDLIGNPTDEEIEKATEKLKESFGDLFDDIELENTYSDYEYDTDDYEYEYAN